MHNNERTPLLVNTKKTDLIGMNFEKAKNVTYKIDRKIFTIDELKEGYGYEVPKKSIVQNVVKQCKEFSLTDFIISSIPILRWLPKYNWDEYLVNDIIAGCTIAVMHIPQGMGYALLANVPAYIGIYMAIFPVLIYTILGTSRHVSIGTFGIVCLLSGEVVGKFSSHYILPNGTKISAPHEINEETLKLGYTNLEVAATLSMCVGLCLSFLFLIRFGYIVSLFSDSLVNGFISASALIIINVQLPDLFDIQKSKTTGYFKFFKAVYHTVTHIKQLNYVTFGISVASFSCLYINVLWIKGFLAKYTRIPFPIELFLILVSCLISYLVDLNGRYGIRIIGDIPAGLPKIAVPRFEIIPNILFDTIVISVISYTLLISLAIIIAKKRQYVIDPNQELIAMSFSNIVGSFFSCLPVTASLSRSVIQENVGGVTQLSSAITSGILFIVTLWLNPAFKFVPMCVLASIIIMALRGLVIQVKIVIKYWHLNKYDAFVWVVTFLVTLSIDLGYGLVAGLLSGLIVIFIQGYRPYSCLLGLIPNTDLYVDLKRYKNAREVQGIKIFHYTGSLTFASISAFKKHLESTMGIVVSSSRAQAYDIGEAIELISTAIIIDFSAITFIDPAGVDLLRSLHQDFKAHEVLVVLAAPASHILEKIKHCDRYQRRQSNMDIFPTIHDAVLFCQEIQKRR